MNERIFVRQTTARSDASEHATIHAISAHYKKAQVKVDMHCILLLLLIALGCSIILLEVQDNEEVVK